jgi:hypothetical protein
MLGLWLGLGALAVSPKLHQLLHQDAQAPAHHCLISQCSKASLLDGVVGQVFGTPPAGGEELPCFTEVRVLTTADRRLSPSRAPPEVFSSIRVVG